MAEIISFVKKVQYGEMKPEAMSEIENKDAWLYQIIFQGVHDQIYYFADYAYVGKTRYKIDKNTVTDFQTLCRKLNQITIRDAHPLERIAKKK